MKHRALIGLELFMALSCAAGMVLAVTGAQGVPRDWLDGSPFHDYVVPGLILGVVVGGSLVAAGAALWRDIPQAMTLTRLAAAVLLAWIVAETAVIGLVSALQPIVAAYAVLLLVLGRRSAP